MSWVAVAVAGTGLVGAYVNNKASKAQAGQQQPLIDLQAQNAKLLQPYIGDFYGRSERAFDPAMGYFKSLLSGNRGTIAGALSPEIGSINSSYDRIAKTQGELAPRGGASAGFMAELPYKRADDVQALIAGARPAAAASLVGMSGTAANIGAGAAGMSGSAVNNAVQNQQGVFDRRNAANNQNALAVSALLASLAKYDGDTKSWNWAWQGG